MSKTYEIRDPIHGFIVLNEWERRIIDHPVFQRLRRIRHLGLTDMVYPGAMHTRFEHSLGVMHVASQMYDEIVSRRRDLLESELSFSPGGIERQGAIVRIACLLHDVGQPPFSHAGEDLLPYDPSLGQPYGHEEYSAAAILHLMRDVIDSDPYNQKNYGIKAEDVADFLAKPVLSAAGLLWRSLVSGQLDADRADYLLRDSHHAGVAYGRYDLNRLLKTLTIAIDPETEAPIVAVEDGGLHAAEGLLVARYMMFTQVYFHHTRRAYDYHLAQALRSLLAEKQQDSDLEVKDAFPPPDPGHIEDYLQWDDWRVLGELRDRDEEHARILRERRHHRCVHATPEVPDSEELDFVEHVCQHLGAMVSHVDRASKSWYNLDEGEEILILMNPGQDERLKPLSQLSTVVKGLKPVNQARVYVPLEQRDEALRLVKQMVEEREQKKQRDKEKEEGACQGQQASRGRDTH